MFRNSLKTVALTKFRVFDTISFISKVLNVVKNVFWTVNSGVNCAVGQRGLETLRVIEQQHAASSNNTLFPRQISKSHPFYSNYFFVLLSASQMICTFSLLIRPNICPEILAFKMTKKSLLFITNSRSSKARKIVDALRLM